MSPRIFTTLSAVTGVAVMWLLAGIGTGNLHSAAGWIIQVLLVVISGIVSGVTGWVISRRRDDPRVIAFGATAGAASGAVCGAAYSLLMGVAYVATFGGPPVSFSDGLVVILAFPVFGALGALVGSVPGAAFGATFAYLAQRFVHGELLPA